VTDVAKVRLGGWEIRRMGYVLCSFFVFFCFVFGLKMYVNSKKVAMVTSGLEQSGRSHSGAGCNGHLGACGTRSHA
jgi:hypothetical protein